MDTTLGLDRDVVMLVALFGAVWVAALVLIVVAVVRLARPSESRAAKFHGVREHMEPL